MIRHKGSLGRRDASSRIAAACGFAPPLASTAGARFTSPLNIYDGLGLGFGFGLGALPVYLPSSFWLRGAL